MFNRHVRERLSAYRHGELSEEEARCVEAHLSQCAACREELREITFGIQLAESLPREIAPVELWNTIEAFLEHPRQAQEAAAPGFGKWWRPAPVGAVVLLLMVASGVVWYTSFRERLRLTVSADAPSGFETAAVNAHEDRLRGDWKLDFQTSEVEPLRAWIQENSHLRASIPWRRPREDAGRLRILGVKLVTIGGARAAVIAYDVDSKPVTLVAARLSDLRHRPEEGLFRKDIVYRYDPARGHRVLTWGTDGQAYVMVSDLPGYGQQGCFLCHTTPERRQLIQAMKPL